MDEFMESTAGGPKLPALKFVKVGDTHTGVVTEVTKLKTKTQPGTSRRTTTETHAGYSCSRLKP